MSVRRTNTIFKKLFYVFTKQIPIFQKHLYLLTNTYRFSRKPFSNINEQRYRFSRSILQLPRLDNDFPGSHFLISTKRQAISRKIPPSEQIFQQWLLSILVYHPHTVPIKKIKGSVKSKTLLIKMVAQVVGCSSFPRRFFEDT